MKGKHAASKEPRRSKANLPHFKNHSLSIVSHLKCVFKLWRETDVITRGTRLNYIPGLNSSSSFFLSPSIPSPFPPSPLPYFFLPPSLSRPSYVRMGGSERRIIQTMDGQLAWKIQSVAETRDHVPARWKESQPLNVIFGQ